MTESQITAQKLQETNPMGGGIPASPKRVEWIDIAKGITIILVVLYHCSCCGAWYNRIGGSFRMPLFFMLSGLCFNDLKYPQFWEYFKRKTRFLLWPMYALSFIYVVLCITFTDRDYKLIDVLIGDPIGPMWFVWVLYLSELVLFLLCKVVKKRYLIIPLLVSLAVGILFDKYHIENKRFIGSFFSSLFFYGLGFYCKDILKKVAEYKWCCVFVLLAIIQGTMLENYMALRPNKIYGGFYHTIPIAIFASVGVMAVCRHYIQYWDKIKRPLVWCGKNSFVILAFHWFGIILTCKYFKPSLYESNLIAFEIVQQIIVWSICICLVLLINRYAKWILGK